jgi:molybdate transport system ATP-binding protein
VKKLLEGFHKEVLLVTHNRDEAYAMCSYLMIMDHGRLCGRGKTKEVFANPGTIPAAILTGCKNIYPAKKAGETMIEIPDFGLVMDAGAVVGEDVCAVGIRAHYFNPRAKTNCFDIVLDEEVESPFEWTIKFRYASQNESSPSVWWRLPKDKKLPQFPEQLGVAPTNLLLLYPEQKSR